MCCIMGYTGHDLPAAEFKEYLLRTVSRWASAGLPSWG